MKRISFITAPQAATRLRHLFKVASLSIAVMTIGMSATDSGVKKIYSKEFEQAISVIKKYEGLHRDHGELIGYGHKVVAGDKFASGSNLTERQADALLRADLEKLCAKYRSFGKDSLILSALAYNCGEGTVARSTIYKKLQEGDRDIKDTYISYSKYRGKTLDQLKRRRIEEFDTLYIPD
ncbi:MAG: glycoside hydrolase family protein [Duncaniella sp.]|nr:glycoside hydrolase family protein [Duncaniella sp.]